MIDPIRDAVKADAHALAGRVRAADRAEIAAASGASLLKALLAGFRHSVRPKVVEHEGRAEALFGVIPTGPGEGFPWMIGSDAITGKAKWPFARVSRREVEEMQAMFPRLAGRVHAENVVHIRWLEWCGFTLSPPEPFGGAMFRRFERHV